MNPMHPIDLEPTLIASLFPTGASWLPLVAALLLLGSVSPVAAWSWGGIKGEGDIVARTRTVDAFEGVVLHGGGTLRLAIGDEFSVRIETHENIHELIETNVRDGTLHLETSQGVNLKQGPLYRVTAPVLRSAHIRGGGNIEAEDVIRGDHFEIAISGAGDVQLDLEVEHLDSRISGAGDIRLSGSARSFDVHISGAGDVKAGGLQAHSATVSISGAGDVTVRARDKLDIRIAGAGDVKYYGDPTISQKVMGAGDVKRAGD